MTFIERVLWRERCRTLKSYLEAADMYMAVLKETGKGENCCVSTGLVKRSNISLHSRWTRSGRSSEKLDGHTCLHRNCSRETTAPFAPAQPGTSMCSMYEAFPMASNHWKAPRQMCMGMCEVGAAGSTHTMQAGDSTKKLWIFCLVLSI